MNDKILDHELREAVRAHGAWKLKLSTAIITGQATVTPQELSCDNCCAFGKWLESTAIDRETRAGKPYQVVSRLHREFHRIAGEVLTKALAGDNAGARTVFEGAYKEKSEKLTAALTKWRTEAKARAIHDHRIG